MHGSQGKLAYGKHGNEKVVIKKSKSRDRLIELEIRVLETIARECPELSAHFPRLIGTDGTETMVMTRIEGTELHSAISDLHTSNCKNVRSKASKIVRNMCFVTICVMEILRRKTGIIHNDLHTSNVMLAKTDRVSFEFTIEGASDRHFSFKSYGYCPVIIDFGSAYIPGNEILASLQNTDLGCFPHEPDLLADSRLLLCTASSRLDNEFRDAVKSIFGPLKLDRNGWFPKDVFVNVLDKVYDFVGVGKNSSSRETDAKLSVVISKMGKLVVSDVDDAKAVDAAKAAYDKLMEPELVIVDNGCPEVTEAVDAFRSIVVDAVNRNREILEVEYAKLNVKDGLEVIETILQIL